MNPGRAIFRGWVAWASRPRTSASIRKGLRGVAWASCPRTARGGGPRERSRERGIANAGRRWPRTGREFSLSLVNRPRPVNASGCARVERNRAANRRGAASRVNVERVPGSARLRLASLTVRGQRVTLQCGTSGMRLSSPLAQRRRRRNLRAYFCCGPSQTSKLDDSDRLLVSRMDKCPNALPKPVCQPASLIAFM
jgi:hypothetical protein